MNYYKVLFIISKPTPYCKMLIDLCTGILYVKRSDIIYYTINIDKLKTCIDLYHCAKQHRSPALLIIKAFD